MMEREFVGVSLHHTAEKRELEKYLRHACRYYKIKPPKLSIYDDPKDETFGYAESDIHEDGSRSNTVIFLNRGYHGANLITLLHELAHYIADDTWPGHSGHGPKFVAVYMHLLHKYRVIPRDAFRLIAKRRNIRIHNKFRPDAIRG